MARRHCGWLVITAAVLGANAAEETRIFTLVRPPVAPANTLYPANRPPLQPSGLVRLPPGSVQPAGWLRQMLRMQADGFHGHLQELSRFLKKDGNAWLSRAGKGSSGWEEVPYWLKGYLNCAYALHDEAMTAEAHKWIEAALAGQQPDGWFGPGEGRTGAATDLVGKEDLWPNMIMLFCLQDYFDRTGDKRVIEHMRKYFRYLEKVPEDRFLKGYWPSMRGGDQLYSILWLYNRTGEEWLLDLARKTHRKTARWDKGLIDRHNVNIAQASREPATYWQLSGDPADRDATERVWKVVREKFGRVPGGMFGADEDARDGFDGPRQAIETCGMVEEMLSDELLIAITADPAWAERCENVAFNSLPAAFTADMKALRYLTSPNLPKSDHVSKAPGVENGGPMFEMDPHGHRCCQHNGGHGWPYFNHHLWYATAGDGLAAYVYAPCEVIATVTGGVNVKIEERTRYPFEEQIEFVVTPERPVRFPLYLRVPTWCQDASVLVNGSGFGGVIRGGQVIGIEHEWKPGDRVKLKLPMTAGVHVWSDNRNTISVNRGPLTYSLKIDTQAVRHGGTDVWPAWDLLPASPWNYGLESNPELRVVTRAWPADDRPFTTDAPVAIRAKARRIPNWTLDRRGLVREVITGPVKSAEPVEEVTLIPMGAARLRITAFPRIIANGKDWPAPPQPRYRVSASHCFENDLPEAACDGVIPKNSRDDTIDRFTWWPHQGTTEWLQYEFAKPTTVSGAGVYWFIDSPPGGCKAPKAWRLLYRDGTEWRPVEQPTGYTTAADTFNDVKFTPVTTDALRLEVRLELGASAGVLEWRVSNK